MPSRGKKTGVLGSTRHGQSSALFYKGRALRNFSARKFKDGSCKEQQTAVMASNITGEEKETENEHFDYIYYTEKT